MSYDAGNDDDPQVSPDMTTFHPNFPSSASHPTRLFCHQELLHHHPQQPCGNDGGGDSDDGEEDDGEEEAELQVGGRYKAEILGHPMHEQLLSAHVACLRIATPVDQLPRIDAQLEQSQRIFAKYASFRSSGGNGGDAKELDLFMVCMNDTCCLGGMS